MHYIYSWASASSLVGLVSWTPSTLQFFLGLNPPQDHSSRSRDACLATQHTLASMYVLTHNLCICQGIVMTSPAVDVERDLSLRILQFLQPMLLLLCPNVRLIPAIPVDFNTPLPDVVRPPCRMCPAMPRSLSALLICTGCTHEC